MTAVPEVDRFARLAELAEPDPATPVLTEADRVAAVEVALRLSPSALARMAAVDKILYGL